jgi:DNA-binding MarR family transcriptional regulator
MIMTSDNRRRAAELLAEKHRRAGLISDEGRVRMLVAVNMIRTFGQFSTKADAYHRQFGWSWAGFRVLNALWSGGDQEIRDLAEQMWSTRAAVSSAVNKLEAAGMVRRKPVPTDRRLVVVQLTDSGREQLERAIKGQAELEREWLSCLDPQQQRHLAELLHTLADASDARGC